MLGLSSGPDSQEQWGCLEVEVMRVRRGSMFYIVNLYCLGRENVWQVWVSTRVCVGACRYPQCVRTPVFAYLFHMKMIYGQSYRHCNFNVYICRLCPRKSTGFNIVYHYFFAENNVLLTWAALTC